MCEFVAPHATDISFTGELVEILGDAAFNALSISDGAHGIRSAFSDRHGRARRLAARVGVIPAALRAGRAGNLIGGGRARSNTDAILRIPSALGISETVRFSEPAEVALLHAGGTVPQAHGFFLADGLETDAVADSSAGTRTTIPHTLGLFVDADTVVHLVAALVASVVVSPLTEGIGVAGVDAALKSGFLFVVGASVLAHTGVVVPAARFLVGSIGADRFIGGTISALHLTAHGRIVVAEPLAELRSEAERLGVVERSTQTSARIAPFVPAAFTVEVTLGLSLVTVLAELLAFVASGSGVATHVVLNAEVRAEVVASRFTGGLDGVPHAPRIRLARIRSRVQDLALVAAGRNTDGQPFAGGVEGA